MEIKNEERHHAGMFFVEDDGHRLGEMRYLINDGIMNIYHTEVSPELAGRQMGFKLVKAGVEYARANHLKVLPTCPYAASVFERTEAFRDVLAGS